MRRPNLPGNLIYGVVARFFTEKWSASALADWLTTQGYDTSREEIYPIIRQAINHGFVKLCPARAERLVSQLAQAFPMMPADTRVVDVSGPLVSSNLAIEAADLVLGLIIKVFEKKEHKKKRGEPPSRVHVGFGGGDTARHVAEKLALRLKMEPELPPLTFHALSSGFATREPLSAPVAFFSYFSNLNHSIEFVGLFCAPVVSWEEYEEVKKLPVVRDSFKEAGSIDIVVTSLAQADDEHGLLNVFLTMHKGRQAGLGRAGHIGDVQWQPYSTEEPLTVNTGIRAVTLFDLPDLVELVTNDGKHVVLIAGPCTGCGRRKTKAIRPLLSQPSLRMCNHLVTDITTALELLS
jgi:hypothetical protein